MDEEMRTGDTFPGRQFDIREPDGNVIESSAFTGREYRGGAEALVAPLATWA
jgi:hypothetical protein